MRQVVERYKGMKPNVTYIGRSTTDLMPGKSYVCLDVEGSLLRVVDDSGEDYLYAKRDFVWIKPKRRVMKWLKYLLIPFVIGTVLVVAWLRSGNNSEGFRPQPASRFEVVEESVINYRVVTLVRDRETGNEFLVGHGTIVPNPRKGEK